MSNESQFSELVIEPEYEVYWYYYVPLLNRDYWDGIEYDSIRYDWNELDYRFGVEYPAIPEPADAGFVMAFLVAVFVGFCWIKTLTSK